MQPLADERQMPKVDGWLPTGKANVHPHVNAYFAGRKVDSAAAYRRRGNRAIDRRHAAVIFFRLLSLIFVAFLK